MDGGKVTPQEFLIKQLEGFEWPDALTVLVCGGRYFGKVNWNRVDSLDKTRYYFVWDVISDLYCLWLSNKKPRPEGYKFTLVQGGATGVDTAAKEFIEQCLLSLRDTYDDNLVVKTYPADWDKHGKAAGSIRNQLMLYETQPHIVLAFPGGRGTADMVKKAKRRGGKVIEVTYPLS